MSTRRKRLTLLAAVVVSGLTLSACGGGESADTPPPAAQGPAPAPANPEGPGCAKPGTVQVKSSAELTAALANPEPGAVIQLADGNYSGNFTGTAKATPSAPITVCGNRAAVIDGGDANYSFYLNGARYWQLAGFTVKGGQKGVMVDEGQHNVIDGLEISGVGDEALHLRKNSSDNVVRGNIIHDTGQGQEKFGEGIYIGSAKTNWAKYSGGQPDRSDRNLIEGNTVSKTTSEPVDIKEGTTGGILRNNTFTGPMSDAESWVNVKGNGWQIIGNTGHDSEKDGFSVHQILDGWGVDNTFSGNTAVVNGSGYGINVTKNKENNRVTCDNKAEGAAKGLTNGDCV